MFNIFDKDVLPDESSECIFQSIAKSKLFDDWKLHSSETIAVTIHSVETKELVNRVSVGRVVYNMCLCFSVNMNVWVCASSIHIELFCSVTSPFIQPCTPHIRMHTHITYTYTYTRERFQHTQTWYVVVHRCMRQCMVVCVLRLFQYIYSPTEQHRRILRRTKIISVWSVEKCSCF